jgi:competence ComEA-like helix-hairpin-helix protein
MPEELAQLSLKSQERFRCGGYFLGVIGCVLVAFFLSVGYIHCEDPLVCPLPASRINVNTEPAESLERLAGIGAAKAGAIVEYRRQMREQSQDEKVFKTAGDLERVKGIGPKTVKQIEGYLEFE